MEIHYLNLTGYFLILKDRQIEKGDEYASQ